MTEKSSPAPSAYMAAPLGLDHRSLPIRLFAIILGTVALAISSWIEVPMYPVPMTMQTYAVVVVGALYGWRLGGITVLAWLGQAAVGLPVLAGGAGGLLHFAGPTAGYLAAFPIIAVLAGWLVQAGGMRQGLVSLFAIMLAAHGLCLALGATWLAVLIGVEQAIAYGFTPFVLGALLKSGLAAATVVATRRLRRHH